MDGLLHDEYLAALEYVAGQATPGPWEAGLEVDGMMSGHRTVARAEGHRRIVSVGQTRPHVYGHDYREAEANVAFIAAARTAVPVLLAENRRLRALLSLNDLEVLDGTE